MFEKDCITIVSIPGLGLLPYFFTICILFLETPTRRGSVEGFNIYINIACAFSHWIFITLQRTLETKLYD